ncbi:MAG: hypothetical protein WAU24_10010 [Chitinophagaceae bacterium]
MAVKQITKTIFYSLFAACVFFVLHGCSDMGKQPPVWESGMFSPDGKYYVYTWSEIFITQYSKRGNSTFSSGSSTSYLQIIDCATGRKLLEKPLESSEKLTIAEIEDNHVWLVSYEISKRWAPAMFDINSLKMAFSAKDLIQINPSIPMKMQTISFYNNTSGQPGAIFQAVDGRQYVINPQTGKFSFVAQSGERIDTKDETCYQATSSLKDIREVGGTRKKLAKENIESPDDFINPKFLSLEKNENNLHPDPTMYKNNFFVLSPAFTTDNKDMQLTCIDKDSLTTQWSIALPQDINDDKKYNNERFFMESDQLYVANTSNLFVIDLAKGIIKTSYPLFEIKE